MTQRKTVSFTLRMDPRVKRMAEWAAVDDRRSLSALIEVAWPAVRSARSRER
jgi:hypothetical protein